MSEITNMTDLMDEVFRLREQLATAQDRIEELEQAKKEAQQALWAELRTAISNGNFIPLDTSFKIKEMFKIVHWIEAYIDEQAKEAQKET